MEEGQHEFNLMRQQFDAQIQELKSQSEQRLNALFDQTEQEKAQLVNQLTAQQQLQLPLQLDTTQLRVDANKNFTEKE